MAKNITAEDFEKLKQWQGGEPNRIVTVDIRTTQDSTGSHTKAVAYAFDSKYMTGCDVEDVDRINIKSVYQQRFLKEYEELQKQLRGETI